MGIILIINWSYIAPINARMLTSAFPQLAGQRKKDGEYDNNSVSSSVTSGFAGLKQAYW